MSITKMTECSIHLVGLVPMMFDKYAGDNNTELNPEDKMYYGGESGRVLVLPAVNIMSFLCAVNTKSATRLVFGKKAGMYLQAFAAAVGVVEKEIPILRNGKEIEFTGFDKNGVCKSAGVHIERHVARVLKNKNPVPIAKVRPVLETPWEVKFNLTIVPHPDVSEEIITQVFEKGGLVGGFGTFRPVYGRFVLESIDFKEYTK